MEGNNKKPVTTNVITIIFAIIIIFLIAYIFIFGRTSKNSNNPLKVLSITSIEHSEDSLYIELENTSQIDFIGVQPFIVFYDENNIPIYTDYTSYIEYLKSGSTIFLSYTDAPKKFSYIEVGLEKYEDITNHDSTYYNNLLNSISYSITESVDEENDKMVVISGKNSSNEIVDGLFQIKYYSGNELIYIDNCWLTLDSNSDFSEEEYIVTEYMDETPFPNNYRYEVNLVDVSAASSELDVLQEDEEGFYTENNDDDSYVNDDDSDSTDDIVITDSADDVVITEELPDSN